MPYPALVRRRATSRNSRIGWIEGALLRLDGNYLRFGSRPPGQNIMRDLPEERGSVTTYSFTCARYAHFGPRACSEPPGDALLEFISRDGEGHHALCSFNGRMPALRSALRLRAPPLNLAMANRWPLMWGA